MNSLVRERIASPFAMRSASFRRDRRGKPVIILRRAEGREVVSAAAHIGVALVSPEDETGFPALVQGVLFGKQLLELLERGADTSVLNAMRAALKPGMQNAENDSEIEILFAPRSLLREAAADETMRIRPELFEEITQASCFLLKLGRIMRVAFSLGPPCAFFHRRKLHERRVIMLRRVFLPDVVAGFAAEVRRIIEVAADQVRQSDFRVARDKRLIPEPHAGQRARCGAIMLRAVPADEFERPIGIVARFAENALAFDSGDLAIRPHKLQEPGVHLVAEPCMVLEK